MATLYQSFSSKTNVSNNFKMIKDLLTLSPLQIVNLWSVSILERRYEMIEPLIYLGINVNFADKIGINGLYLATVNNDLTMIRLLVKHGADINIKHHGVTNFYIAAAHGFLEIADYFLSGGLDINEIEPISGNSALTEAMKENDQPMVEFLLARGADKR